MNRPTRIEDLTNIEVEHLIGDATNQPLVKVRAESKHTVVVGQIPPDQARQIAAHLTESAARAEYEMDLLTEMRRAGFTDEMQATIFAMVRTGEMHRHTKGNP